MTKLPQKPTDLRVYNCDLVIINGQHFTKLEISPYYEKHNREYLTALKRKRIKLTSKQLAEKLITDDLIRKVLIPQLDGKEIKRDGKKYYHWTYYSFRVYRGVKAYRLVWCVADNEPEILGIVDCYRQGKFDKS